MTFSAQSVRSFCFFKCLIILGILISQSLQAEVGSRYYRVEITGAGDVGGRTGETWLPAGAVSKVTVTGRLSVSAFCGVDIYVKEDSQSYTAEGTPKPVVEGSWVNKGLGASFYKNIPEGGGGGGGGDPTDPTGGGGGSEEREYYVRLEPAVVPGEEDALDDGPDPSSALPASPGHVPQSSSCCQQSTLGTSPGLTQIMSAGSYHNISELQAHYEYPLGGIRVPGTLRTITHGTLVFTSPLSNTLLADNWHTHFGIRTMMTEGEYKFSSSINAAGRGIFQTDLYVYEAKWQGGIRIARYPVSIAAAIWSGEPPTAPPDQIYLIKRIGGTQPYFEFSCYEGGSSTPYRVDKYSSDFGSGYASEEWSIDNGKRVDKYEKKVVTTVPSSANQYLLHSIETTTETLEPRFDGHVLTDYTRTTHQVTQHPGAYFNIALKDQVSGLGRSRTRTSYEYDIQDRDYWVCKNYALADTADEVLVRSTFGGSGTINRERFEITPWLDVQADSQDGYRLHREIGPATQSDILTFFVPGSEPYMRHTPTLAGDAHTFYRKFTFTSQVNVDGVYAFRDLVTINHVFGRFPGGYSDHESGITDAWRFQVKEYYAEEQEAGTNLVDSYGPRPKFYIKGALLRDIELPSKATVYSKDMQFIPPAGEAVHYPVSLSPYRLNWVTADLRANGIRGGSGSINEAFKSTRLETVRGKHGPVSEAQQVWNGSDWITISVRRYTYNAAGKITSISKDGEVVESLTYPDGNTVVTADKVNGTESAEVTDADGRLVSSTINGVPALGSYAAQPDIVTTINEVPLFPPDLPPPPGSGALIAALPLTGIERIENTNAGDLSTTRSSVLDIGGETLSTTDESGYTQFLKTVTDDSLVDVTSRANGAHTLTARKYLDGRVKEVGGTGRIKSVFNYEVKTTGAKGIEETEKMVDGANLRLVRKRLLAGDGEVLSETANNITTAYTYDIDGRLVAKTTGGNVYRYVYDYRNLVIREGNDVNADGQLTPGSTDTVIDRDRYYQLDGGSWWLVNTESTYIQDGNSTAKLTTTRREKQGTGLSSVTEVIHPDGVVETTTRTVSGRLVTTTITSGRYPGRTNTEVEYNGRLVSSQDFTQSQPVLYVYDALGRHIRTTDAGTGQVELRSYDPQSGQLASIRNGSAERVAYGYYPANDVNAGQVKWVQNNAGAKTYHAYNVRGQMTHQWGEATHPLRYLYDGYGALQYLDTFTTQTPEAWKGEALPAAFSGNVYDRRSFWVVYGQLWQRTFSSSPGGASYIYDENGNLKQRFWTHVDSGESSVYTYTKSGLLNKIEYADSTPDVDATYDRSGRLATLTDASGVRSFAYQPNGDVVTTYSSGLLNGLVLSKTHNSAGMVSGMSWSFGGEAHQAGYTYDSQMRLETATLGPVNGPSLVTAAYGYHPDTTRVHTLTRPVTGSLPLVGTFLLDGEGRMDALSWKRGNYFYGGHDYKLNAAGLRSDEGRLDGTRLTYSYNSRGELEEARRYKQANNSLRPDWSHAYAYDDSGTRRSSTTPEGETLSHTLELVPSSTDTMYTSSGETKHWVRGRAHPQASVTVNGNMAARDGELWRSLVTKPSAASALEVSVSAGRDDMEPTPPAPVTQTAILPPSTTGWKFDQRGNLKEDGRWIYTWDLENRLVVQEQKYPGDADAGAKPVKRLEFAYDAYGRRVSKTVLGNERTFNGSLVNGTWTFSKQTVFLWQDWTLVAEFVRTTPSGSLSLRRSYLWGLDVDGTLGGAGGVGGLLWVADYVPGITGSNRQLAPCYDGNGNIMSWVENEGGQVLPLHRLEYDPYGRLLVEEEARVVRTKKQRDLGVTEEWLERPAFGFSTKYEDVETGLLYYGYRYYAPEMGRWISRDPIGEEGGIDIYAFCYGNPANNADSDGRLVRTGTTLDTPTGVAAMLWAAEAMNQKSNPFTDPKSDAKPKKPDSSNKKKTQPETGFAPPRKNGKNKQREEVNVMRLQLQLGFSHIWPLSGTEAGTMRNSASIGVTTNQVDAVLTAMSIVVYYEGRKPSFPRSCEEELDKAIVKMESNVRRYPPYGVTAIGNLRRDSVVFICCGKEYRLDIENIKGINLRQ